MWIMAAHEMLTLGATVVGDVDDTYTPGDLCDGDTSSPIRVDDGNVSLAITGLAAQPVNGLVLANHNLDAGVVATFSGIGSVTAPPVPPGRIRFNAHALLEAPVTVGATTLTLAAGGPVFIGEAIAGLYREVWTLPPESDHPHQGFAILPSGEYPMLGYSKGAQARRFGGSVWLTDFDYAILRDAYLASEESSLPTVIIPFPDEPSLDPWVVVWETWNPKPGPVPDTWLCEATWSETPPRYRWPRSA